MNSSSQRASANPCGSGPPLGKGTLEPFAYDKPIMERLWELSETETGFDWKL